MGDDRIPGEGKGEDGPTWVCPMCDAKSSATEPPFCHEDQINYVRLKSLEPPGD